MRHWPPVFCSSHPHRRHPRKDRTRLASHTSPKKTITPMKPEAMINSANSRSFSALLVIRRPCPAPTFRRVPGTCFPLVSKGSAEEAGALRNHLSFSSVTSFRQVATSGGEGRGAGFSLQRSTVYNLHLVDLQWPRPVWIFLQRDEAERRITSPEKRPSKERMKCGSRSSGG